MKQMITDLVNALPGNSSVSSSTHTRAVNNTVEIFYMISATQQ
jgi:hypothetical protein